MSTKWTDDQVASANAYQKCDYFHPFTSQDGTDLVATPDGWVEKEGGPVVQDWAHPFMLDWGWKEDLTDFQLAILRIRADQQSR